MTNARRSRVSRQGGATLILVLIAVFVLGLLGLAGSAGANSFASTAERLMGDRAAALLARQALAEAADEIASQANLPGTPWHDQLTARRIHGAKFDPAPLDIAVDETHKSALAMGLDNTQIKVTAKVCQQNPFGVQVGTTLYGGDQSYGTIALEAEVELAAPRSKIFPDGRTATQSRWMAFRTTLPSPPAPFDRSTFWVEDPEFLQKQAAALKKVVSSSCPGAPANLLDQFDDAVKGFVYAEPKLTALTADQIGIALAPGDCSGTLGTLKGYYENVSKALLSLEGAGMKQNMTRFFWPQVAADQFAGADRGRADHAFATQEQLMKFLGKARPVALRGIYHVAGPVTIDFEFTGRATIVSGTGIEVLRAKRADPAMPHTLTLVATSGDIELSNAQEPIEAALIASSGAVRGLSGKTVRGLLMAHRLSNGFEAGSGTAIEFDANLNTHDDKQMEARIDSLQVHIDSVPIAQF